MKEPCPDPRMLVETSSADPENPWADHLCGCPRCRALLRSRDAFIGDAAAGLSREDEAAAAARLEVFISRLGAEKRRGKLPSWWLGLAAVFIVAVGIWSLGPRLGDGSLPTVRGTDREAMPMRGDHREAPWAAPVLVIEDGILVVTWERFPDADSYDVAVLAADLSPVVRVEAGPATKVGMETKGMMDHAHGGFVVVIALEDGRTLCRSAPASLP